MTLHRKHAEWLLARKLDPALAEQYGLASIQDGQGVWLSIPYNERGETVNHKYRLTSEKRHRMDPGAPLLLWNADCLAEPKLSAGHAPLVITEGEWDALAAIQAGFQFVVSVPNGAPGTPTEDVETAKRYEWVDRHAQTLANVKEFVLATDADQAGYNLAADLAALLGPERCRFIDYPFPCKDLNEVLQEFGPERVVDCITTAKPYPIKGLYLVDDFPERGDLPSYSVGIEPINEMIRIVPGSLTIVTGYANSGKSTMMYSIIGHAMREHFPVCVASFETLVKPTLVNGIRRAVLQCGQHELVSHPDRPMADRLLRERLSIISQTVDEDAEMDLDEFLETCRLAVVRYGAKLLVLDPWNELAHKRRRDESETDYIGRALRAFRRFAVINDVAFWVVAHPRVPMDGTRKMPGLYSISGSANWANKPEYGLVYHRTDYEGNEAEIAVTKVRDGYPGRKGVAKVVYDFRTSQFISRDRQPA